MVQERNKKDKVSKMKTLVLNLPSKYPVIRRFKCSYNAPTFLLPPIELMSVASNIKTVEGSEVRMIDAVAERMDLKDVLNKISAINPDLIISILGIESINDEIELAGIIKKKFPHIKFAAFGWLATVFPEQILKSSNIDMLIRGEPEMTARKLTEYMVNNRDYSGLRGLAVKRGENVSVNEVSERIKNLDVLEFPERGMVNNRLYGEPFFPRPYSVIYSARGCPYKCIYCVPTYGSEVYFRSSENVLKEIEEMTQFYGIKSFRFMDDTFTINHHRVIEICKGMRKLNKKFIWSCLARPDTLNENLIKEMKKAGLRRIYLGIESGSERILKFYRRNYTIDLVRKAVKIIKQNGVEVIGFFIIGGPDETEKDFQATLKLAEDLNCTYTLADRLRPYPGTELFDLYRKKIEFSSIPYTNRYDLKAEKISELRERIFYRTVYFRFGTFFYYLKNLVCHPVEFFYNFFQLLSYLLGIERKKIGRKYI